MKPCIYVCETCRYSLEEPLDENGRSGGWHLHEALVELARLSPRGEEFEVRTTRCLMACDQHCNVHLRAPRKITYIAGRFVPNAESAAAIMEYFEKYLESNTGQVPYKTWPPGMKGHFIARTPPWEN